MKYHIDTIPLWEAMEQDSECPMCLLHAKMENKSVQYYLGDSVMHPDTRETTNEIGFCSHHYGMMYAHKQKLPLGLSCQTRMDYIIDSIDSQLEAMIHSTRPYRKSGIDKLAKNISEMTSSCCICNDISKHMERYYYTFIHMWHEENKFREAFDTSRGLCLHHFSQILQFADNPLSPDRSLQLAKALSKVQKENLQRLAKEVKWFNDKFDHKNADQPWGTSRDALPRAICKLSGHTIDTVD